MSLISEPLSYQKPTCRGEAQRAKPDQSQPEAPPTLQDLLGPITTASAIFIANHFKTTMPKIEPPQTYIDETIRRLDRHQALQAQLAYSAARSDIEVSCEGERMLHGKRFYDPQCLYPHCTDPADRRAVDEAVEYLTLCGLIEKHPNNPQLIHILDLPKS